MSFWMGLYRAAWLALGVLVVIGAVAAFAPPIRQYRELRRMEIALQEEIRLKEEMLHHLQKQQERLQTDPDYVERIAREELGLARPGETVYKFADDEPQTANPAP
ncbi:MAG: septum formation initiator family protein [Kiritimatiellae bacterium]|nr:septum formation initiator family protein [Kiritimatiellia bacterium]